MCKKNFKKYHVYASLIDHISDGFVMVNNASWSRRTIVKVIPKKRLKKSGVWCEALNLDDYLRKAYNEKSTTLNIQPTQDAIVISKWYRDELGINTKEEIELCIYEPGWFRGIIGKILACLSHPMVGIRVATWLAILSIVIGIAGIVPSYTNTNSQEHAGLQTMIEKTKYDVQATSQHLNNWTKFREKLDTESNNAVHEEIQQLLNQTSALTNSVAEISKNIADHREEISHIEMNAISEKSARKAGVEAEKNK